ncbi:MAG: DUF4198 domain-containing protein [Terriglobia bacterium]
MKPWLHSGVFLLLAAGTLCAHDTWLVPESFRVQAGRPLKVALNTSEDFPVSEAAAGPDRIARFEVVSAAGRREVTGYRVEGKSLVAEVTPGQGVTLVAAVTRPRLIVLEPKEFNNYITEERLDDIVAARAARDETTAEGRERYSKIAKLVLCADSTFLAFRHHRYREPLGLRLEIIPLTNPCELRENDILIVQVLFEGRPLANAWVVVGTTGTHGHHYPYRQRTDAEGGAMVPFFRSGAWFVRVLHMVPATEFDDADWQSWFSTLTFAVE